MAADSQSAIIPLAGMRIFCTMWGLRTSRNIHDATLLSLMDTSFSRATHQLPSIDGRTADETALHPCIYSFRCSRGMEESLARMMREQGLNRTSVIRLGLYALDCLYRRVGGAALSPAELVENLEGLAPGRCLSFEAFMRGSRNQPSETSLATGAACAEGIPPASSPATPQA